MRHGKGGELPERFCAAEASRKTGGKKKGKATFFSLLPFACRERHTCRRFESALSVPRRAARFYARHFGRGVPFSAAKAAWQAKPGRTWRPGRRPVSARRLWALRAVPAREREAGCGAERPRRHARRGRRSAVHFSLALCAPVKRAPAGRGAAAGGDG